jgi:hypothetical protein
MIETTLADCLSKRTQEAKAVSSLPEKKNFFEGEMRRFSQRPSDAELFDRISTDTAQTTLQEAITLTEQDYENIKLWEQMQRNGFRKQKIAGLKSARLEGTVYWHEDEPFLIGGFDRKKFLELLSKQYIPLQYEDRHFLAVFRTGCHTLSFEESEKESLRNAAKLERNSEKGPAEFFSEYSLWALPRIEAELKAEVHINLTYRNVYLIGKLEECETRRPKTNEEIKRTLEKELFKHVFGIYPPSEEEILKCLGEIHNIPVGRIQLAPIIWQTTEIKWQSPEQLEYPVPRDVFITYQHAKSSGLFEKLEFGVLKKDPVLTGTFRGFRMPLIYWA